MIDKNWMDKCSKSRAHILRCIDEAYKMKNIDLVLKNVERLHQLTSHYERTLNLQLNEVNILKEENSLLESDNRRLMNENFLLINKTLGEKAYSTAKRLMDEFNQKWEEDEKRGN